jgi:hypothetical protein
VLSVENTFLDSQVKQLDHFENRISKGFKKDQVICHPTGGASQGKLFGKREFGGPDKFSIFAGSYLIHNFLITSRFHKTIVSQIAGPSM